MSDSENWQPKCSTMTSRSRCDDCTHLVDGRYCLKWRDIVPDAAKIGGCDEFTDAPPF